MRNIRHRKTATVFLLLILGWKVTLAEPVVVVLPFSNSTGSNDYSPLEIGLQDLLIVDLSRFESVVVVDRERLNTLLKEQKLGLQGNIDPSTAAKTGKLIGANLVVLGSFVVVDGRLRVGCRAVDVATSAIVAAEHVANSPAALIQIGEQLSQRLGASLKLKPHNPQALATDPTATSSLHFLRGLGFHYSDQHEEAIAAFTRCLQLDKHADARFWIAKSYLADGEWAHARIELQRFVEAFPNHERAVEANEMLSACDRNLTADQRRLLDGMGNWRK